MARAPRWYSPDCRFYEVIIKCSGDEMLMRPDALAVFLIAQALRGATLKHTTVKLVAFGFVSNHAHLILMVSGDGRAISAFMKTLDQAIAQALNRHRGRGGHFFKGEPKITAILDDAYLYDRLTYTHSQPVRHDLVERVEDWPGLSSFRSVCDGKESVDVAWLDEESWHEAGGRRDQIAKYTWTVSIPVTPIPMWEELSEAQLRAARLAHEQSVRDRERDKAAERAAAGKHRGLGDPRRLTKVDPFSRPVDAPKSKPKPWAYGSAEAVKAYREAYSVMLAAYTAASEAFRTTGQRGEFPEGTFAPWAYALSEVS